MYSLYSSCVSKSQRPRGPFLLPCSERTTWSSCSADAGQGSSCSPAHPGKISVSRWPQFNGLVYPVWPWHRDSLPKKRQTGDPVEKEVGTEQHTSPAPPGQVPVTCLLPGMTYLARAQAHSNQQTPKHIQQPVQGIQSLCTSLPLSSGILSACTDL